MKHSIMQGLIKIANRLDDLSLTKEADLIDAIIFKVAQDNDSKIYLLKPNELSSEENEKLLEMLDAADNHPEFKGFDLVKGETYDDRRLIIMGDGEVVGFMTPRKEGDYWRTGAIYIIPSERGKGYGSAAIRTFFKDKSGKIWIADKNEESKRAFQASGFEKDEPKQFDGDDGHYYIKK